MAIQVAVMVDDEGDIAAFEDYTGEESAAPEAAAPAAEPAADASPSAKPDAPAQRTVASGPRIIASPLAKRMAREANVSLEVSPSPPLPPLPHPLAPPFSASATAFSHGKHSRAVRLGCQRFHACPPCRVRLVQAQGGASSPRTFRS